MKKQMLIYSYSGILISNKKEQTFHTSGSLVEFPRHESWVTKVRHRRWHTVSHCDRNPVSGCLGQRWRPETRGTLKILGKWGMEMFSILIGAVVTRKYVFVKILQTMCFKRIVYNLQYANYTSIKSFQAIWLQLWKCISVKIPQLILSQKHRPEIK